MNALILGATGLVGGHCLKGLLASPHYHSVLALVRRPLEIDSSKLSVSTVPFEEWPLFTPSFPIHHVFCAFGTTIKKAGTQEEMVRIDLTMPLTLAKRMKELGASHFSLVTSLGANAKSSVFYNRIKGELEDGITALGFDSTVIIRPSIIGGERPLDQRNAESWMQKIGKLAPKSVRTVPAERIAHAMLAGATSSQPGTHIILSKDLW